jgi:DNA-binding HxlR family transcriptional regulator
VRKGRSERLLGRVRWPSRGGTDGTLPGSGGGEPGEHDNHRHTLDWMAVLAQLGPVRHRWDLAILSNLDETAGRRPADLLAAINSQAGPGRQLSPQVLSGRLRALEHDGYVRHEDLSVMPLHRVYFLQPPGHALISDLMRIISHGCPASGVAGAAGDQQ